MRIPSAVRALALLPALSACTGAPKSQTCAPPPAPTCAPGGTGTIVVQESGLPEGVTGRVTLAGPSVQELTRAQTLSGVGSGTWSASAEKVAVADPRVRTAYAPTVSPATFCLANGSSQTVTVTWAPIGSSNKLWVTNGTGGAGQLLGFGASSTRASGSPLASVAAQAPGGGDLAFDPDGNLWTAGATVSDPALVRFPAASLGSSGQKTADREINLPGSACSPLVAGLAFDPEGNLYLSSPCRNAVLRVDASALAASGTVTPSLSLSVEAPQGLAFDRDGNLWVADQHNTRVSRYDAAALAAGGAPTASRSLGALASDDPADTSLLSPNWLAFDALGNLWSNDFGGNIFFKLGAADLAGTGSAQVKPQVRMTSGVTALLEGFAFDEEGGLWSAGSQGKLVRFGPEQLGTSTNAGAPTMPTTVLSSSDIGYVSNVALYPAPAALPLYGRLP